MTIPGIGPVTATAIAATIRDIEAFASGREFAAFLGLTPRQHSTGGKERSDALPRWATAICASFWWSGRPARRSATARPATTTRCVRWASGLLERKAVKYAFKLTAVALANKLARIVYALMTRGGQYDDRPVAI